MCQEPQTANRGRVPAMEVDREAVHTLLHRYCLYSWAEVALAEEDILHHRRLASFLMEAVLEAVHSLHSWPARTPEARRHHSVWKILTNVF